MLHPGLGLFCVAHITGAGKGVRGTFKLVWRELTKPGVQIWLLSLGAIEGF